MLHHEKIKKMFALKLLFYSLSDNQYVTDQVCVYACMHACVCMYVCMCLWPVCVRACVI